MSEFTDKPLVYIAGPYTRPDPVENTHDAVKAAEFIEAHGCAVVIPHLSLLWHAINPSPINVWYERDLQVLARCDALVRLPGESTGADAEVRFAYERGIPVFYGRSPVELAEFIGDWHMKRAEWIDLLREEAEIEAAQRADEAQR